MLGLCLISDVEYLCMYSLTSCVFSLEICLFKPFAYIWTGWFFCCWVFSVHYEHSSFADKGFADNFSHFVNCLFILLILYFGTQVIKIFKKPTLLIFFFLASIFDVISKKSSATFNRNHSLNGFGTFVKNHFPYIWGIISELSCVPLACMPAFVPVPHGFDYCSFFLSFETRKHEIPQLWLSFPCVHLIWSLLLEISLDCVLITTPSYKLLSLFQFILLSWSKRISRRTLLHVKQTTQTCVAQGASQQLIQCSVATYNWK